MNVTIQPNPYTATTAVRLNQGDPDLISLLVTEREDGASHTADLRVTLDRAMWQTVVDQLAAVGIAAESVTA